MSKTRVLVVDDSVVIRRIVSKALGSSNRLEVVGSAANGRLALDKVRTLRPDVVVLDVEMPELDGLGTLRELRRLYPTLPIFMFSTETERGARVTVEALTSGATGYAHKPSGLHNFEAGVRAVEASLLPLLEQHFERPVVQRVTRAIRTLPPRSSVEVVAIGASTGGPEALTKVLSALPENFPVPILVVQHMPPVFTRLLAQSLNQRSPLRVEECQGGETPRPGEVWIAPGGHHMVISELDGRRSLKLTQTPPENSCRPAVDCLLRSVAEIYGGRALAVVLTGMGKDGLRGCEQIRAAGGRIVVQDEQTSVVWGMPGFVAKEGLADTIAPISEIASVIDETVRSATTWMTQLKPRPNSP